MIAPKAMPQPQPQHRVYVRARDAARRRGRRTRFQDRGETRRPAASGEKGRAAVARGVPSTSGGRPAILVASVVAPEPVPHPNASRLPPTESTERAMSSAVRVVVPLNNMCSMKCEIPFCCAVSCREPVPIQNPTDTERMCGIASVITRIPFERVVASMSRASNCGAELTVGGAMVVDNYFVFTTNGMDRADLR